MWKFVKKSCRFNKCLPSWLSAAPGPLRFDILKKFEVRFQDDKPVFAIVNVCSLYKIQTSGSELVHTQSLRACEEPFGTGLLFCQLADQDYVDVYIRT